MCKKDPPRKTRSKTRKPKFLSLRLQISPENCPQSGEMTKKTAAAAAHRHQKLNLFPLHPENLVEAHEVDNVAHIFASADGGASTLTTLFGPGSDDDDTQSPSSVTYAYGAQEEGELVRTALRNKERDASEERWVCYSEVVERKDEEVTSCDAGLRYKMQTRGLSLKLDYQEIMNAWSDKGPLYIHLEEAPQTVPDLQDDFFAHHNNRLKDGWGGLWTVPEKSIISSSDTGDIKVKEEVILLGGGGGGGGGEGEGGGGGGGGGEWMVGAREASVLRYKEKRQNRLFSKRIRYEVRKINAEKRPRMKGRFVKRS